VLAFAGISDYLDGKIARALGQTSKLGVVLDPAADRLYILATLVAFVLRDIIPWWLAAIIVGRDLVLAPSVWLLRRRGIAPLNVSYLGKSATFCLLYAFPLLLIGAHDWPCPTWPGRSRGRSSGGGRRSTCSPACCTGRRWCRCCGPSGPAGPRVRRAPGDQGQGRARRRCA
jgi:hypothetical protein